MLVHGEVLRDDGSLEPLRERWRAALFAGLDKFLEGVREFEAKAANQSFLC